MSMKEDVHPRNDKGLRHGLCIWYLPNGNVNVRRRYVNGIRHGIDEVYSLVDGRLLCLGYSKNNDIVYSENYFMSINTNTIEFII